MAVGAVRMKTNVLLETLLRTVPEMTLISTTPIILILVF